MHNILILGKQVEHTWTLCTSLAYLGQLGGRERAMDELGQHADQAQVCMVLLVLTLQQCYVTKYGDAMTAASMSAGMLSVEVGSEVHTTRFHAVRPHGAVLVWQASPHGWHEAATWGRSA